MRAKPMAAGLAVLAMSAIACNAEPEPPQAPVSDTENSENDAGYSASIVHTTDECDGMVVTYGRFMHLLPEELRRISDLVVGGTPVSRERVYWQYQNERGFMACEEETVVSFRVDEYYKGEGPDIIRFLHTDKSSGDRQVEDGVSYLLFLQTLESEAWQEYLSDGYYLTAQWQGVWKVEGDRAIWQSTSMKVSDLMTLGVRRYPIWD